MFILVYIVKTNVALNKQMCVSLGVWCPAEDLWSGKDCFQLSQDPTRLRPDEIEVIRMVFWGDFSALKKFVTMGVQSGNPDLQFLQGGVTGELKRERKGGGRQLKNDTRIHLIGL